MTPKSQWNNLTTYHQNHDFLIPEKRKKKKKNASFNNTKNLKIQNTTQGKKSEVYNNIEKGATFTKSNIHICEENEQENQHQ